MVVPQTAPVPDRTTPEVAVVVLIPTASAPPLLQLRFHLVMDSASGTGTATPINGISMRTGVPGQSHLIGPVSIPAPVPNRHIQERCVVSLLPPTVLSMLISPPPLRPPLPLWESVGNATHLAHPQPPRPLLMGVMLGDVLGSGVDLLGPRPSIPVHTPAPVWNLDSLGRMLVRSLGPIVLVLPPLPPQPRQRPVLHPQHPQPVQSQVVCMLVVHLVG